MLLAGALREQIMRHLTRMKKVSRSNSFLEDEKMECARREGRQAKLTVASLFVFILSFLSQRGGQPGSNKISKKAAKEAISQEVIDPDADAEGEEEDELISGDELEEEEREEEEKEDEAGVSFPTFSSSSTRLSSSRLVSS